MHRCVLCGEDIPIEGSRCEDLRVCADCAWQIATRYSDRIEANARGRQHQSVLERRALRATLVDQRMTRTTPYPWDKDLVQTESVVYYVALGSHIKIGYSAHLRQRIQGLRAAVDQVLALELGGRDEEKFRHQQFDHLRINRRWENFDHGPDLDAHINELRERNGLPLWLTVKRRGKNSPVYIRRAGS